jgi:hypothetical protein
LIIDDEEIKKLAAQKLIDELTDSKEKTRDLSSASLSADRLSSAPTKQYSLSKEEPEDPNKALFNFRKSLSEDPKPSDTPLSKMAAQSKVTDPQGFLKTVVPEKKPTDQVQGAANTLATIGAEKAVSSAIKPATTQATTGATTGATTPPPAVGDVTQGLLGPVTETGMGATPFYVPAAAAVGTYLAGKDLYGLAKGKPEDKSPSGYAGRAQSAISTGGLSEVARAVGIGPGQKHKDVYARDTIRNGLQGYGFLDDKRNLTLADGTKYSVGFDQNASFTGADGKTQVKRAYELDTSNILSPSTVGMINPIAEIITAGDDKLRSDYAGMFSNAAMSNAGEDPMKVRDNALQMYKGLGYTTPEKVFVALDKLKQSGKITDAELAAYKNGVSVLFSGKLPDGKTGVEQAQANMQAGRVPSVPRPPAPVPAAALNTPPPNFQAMPPLPPNMPPANYAGNRLPAPVDPATMQAQSQNWTRK